MPLHPFITAMLDTLKDAPGLSAGSPDDARAFIAAGRARLGEGPAMHQAVERTIAGRSGSIRARLLLPVETPDGVIVFLHGGGWVLGALEDYETYARTLAARSGFAVLAVDYRLAPEAPFPAGLEDCEDSLSAVLAGLVDGCPPGPVVVMGDSAGGNLAAVCCARLPDPSAVALQVLYYPVTDHDFDRPSYRENGSGRLLTAQDMRWFFGLYAPPSTWADPDVSPLRRADLSGLPAAIVVTAEYDVLRDEGAAYANRLAAQGVPVVHRRIEGITHGFIRLHPLFDLADAELSTISNEIRSHVLLA